MKKESFSTYASISNPKSNKPYVITPRFSITQNDNMESLKIELYEFDKNPKLIDLIISNYEGLIRLRNMLSGIIIRRTKILKW